METQTFKAIPTEYRGIKLKSRLEAQTAYLFDQLGWEWRYEPQSYMLPNGVSYTPDFFLPAEGMILECRGYDSDKGRLQIEGFTEMVRGGSVKGDVERGPMIVDSFCVLHGEGVRGLYHGAELPALPLIHCEECGWHVLVIDKSCLIFCPWCAFPMIPGEQNQLDRLAIVTAAAGKILVNGAGVEEFHG